MKIRSFLTALTVVAACGVSLAVELPERGTNLAPSTIITSSPLQKSDVKPGITRDEALAILGKPKATITSASGTKETLIYDRGDIVVDQGQVTEIRVIAYFAHVEAIEKAMAAEGEKKPWYTNLAEKFKKEEKPSGPMPTKLSDLAQHYTSDAKYRWKLHIDPASGYGRVEGPEGYKTAAGMPFADRDCQIRIVGNELELEYLGYKEDSVLTWVKMFTIVDRNHLKSNDKNLFPGTMVANDSVK